MYITRLARIGNSTGVTLPREVLMEAHLDRGDEIALEVKSGKIEISKIDDLYNTAMDIGREGMRRYRRTLKALAK